MKKRRGRREIAILVQESEGRRAMKNQTKKTTKNDVLEALARDVTRLERDLEQSNAEYGRYDRALNELMRDVLRFVGDPLSTPTSINGGQLIAALAKASHTIHDRSR